MDIQTITSWLFVATMIIPIVALFMYVSSRRGKASGQGERPSPVAYGSSIVLGAVVGYGVGVSVGIGVGCSQGGGNLCGLVAFFMFGPLSALGAAILAPLLVFISGKNTGKSENQNDPEL
jgi:uncharacterized membrane protein